jgi:hypothetical protein
MPCHQEPPIAEMNAQSPENGMPDDEPKIIVDSDWKEQVAREKQQTSVSAGSASHQDQPEERSKEDRTASPPPPATFEMLVTMLFTQAMAMLGQIPDPNSGETSINKPYAKHSIDTLEMLSEKTRGNLSHEETAMLSQALHVLRMTYVDLK